jgi:capsular exopolysaccharide synthesis family protein
MSDVDDPPKIIEVTSALPGEGKTTIALSLAVSAAASGLKVLVVDADLRHPSASRMLGFKNTTGLVDVLMGAARAQDAVHYWEAGKLWILTCGSRTQNPQGLLTSDRMKALIPGFKSAFDLVVLDTPPVGPVIDPIAVAQLADKVVLVVRWASTERELVNQAVQQLAGRKKVAGVVFNLVDEQEAQKYGKYAYRYYHGSRSYGKYYKE